MRSEKEHASEIDEALRIAVCAMQRGRYATVVSALEKVTKYCSTNSNIDGKVLRAFSFPWAVACESVCMSEPMLLGENSQPLPVFGVECSLRCTKAVRTPILKKKGM